MPIGVQLIAAPWNELILLRAAAWLEDQGILLSRPCPVPVA
jgi:Asp-tRNA(Asn)/Glu-tRNA(Gln) amidotransferase A subunit family amidase